MSAHANGCSYSEAYAVADSRRAGLSGAALAAFEKGDFSAWTDDEKAALEFARKMTVQSSEVTDGEFATLVKAFGEKKAAAMVLLTAWSNFQDRLLNCLGATVEDGGPLPPMDVAFAKEPAAHKTNPAPMRKAPALPKPDGSARIEDARDWTALDYPTLQGMLEKQRQRPTRVSVPKWQDIEPNLPPGLFAKPSQVVWNRVVLGHVPELAVPWEMFMRIGGADAGPKLDRIFSIGMFWVTTRAMSCPYCMGHCEMNWEVAGLTPAEIMERSRLLSGDDWSSFPPEQRVAFAFARKLTMQPGKIALEDVRRLRDAFGPETALVVALSACRNHYMTRISNGFQLTLERDNVFFDYWGIAPPAGHPLVTKPAVELMSDEECWKRLPRAAAGGHGPLPNWAKAVATQLPRTAAAMLQLDYAQRAKSPLDGVLRAKMRWIIAHANRCDYSQAYALADLKRCGGDPAALTGDPDVWPKEDRDPLEFARLLTVAAPTIGDDLFARLRDRFGEKKVAAMVLLAAYGNFQDRIVLGLNLPMETAGPLPPLDVCFAAESFQSAPILPPQGKLPERRPGGLTVVEPDPEWTELTYDELQARLEKQRARASRLPVPTWDEVRKGLPPEFTARPTRIVWNLVGMGYAPELAVPWTVATRTMWSEAPQDRVFEESLFWVETRAVRCNYCMGHCEMLLEVAGLDKSAVAERTRRLASNDWGAFAPTEQRAYAYARKLSKTPWLLAPSEFAALETDLGPKAGMAVFWWLCRGLYMTRVSDGFQLALERDNVFGDVPVAPKK